MVVGLSPVQGVWPYAKSRGLSVSSADVVHDRRHGAWAGKPDTHFRVTVHRKRSRYGAPCLVYDECMVEGTGRGRPRSESARAAVLHAVDDLLVEVGYAALTMKGIAERAGVGRQTVYRWWSNKAEVLYEASVTDARQELAVSLSGDARADVRAYLDALIAFLTRSHAGAAYRALLGEAQHDPDVALLLASRDILEDSAAAIVEAARAASGTTLSAEEATALLIGPSFFRVLSGHRAEDIDTAALADRFMRALASP